MKFLSCISASLFVLLTNTVCANTFKTEKWQTANGVAVVFYQAKEVPMVDISLAFAAGSAQDGNDYGISNLTAQLINKGNAGKDATVIADNLADTGAQFYAENSRDMAVFSLRSLSDPKSLNPAIQAFAQIISQPDFPNDAVDREKKQLQMAILQTKQSPDEIANQAFFAKLYQNHPYAHSINGTFETLEALNRDKVLHYYKKYYVANNALLVLVGNIDKLQAQQIAEKLTNGLPKGSRAPATPIATQLTKQEKISIPFPSSQTIIRLGQVGISHQAPDYFPLLVGNYILGGGTLVSRLGEEVREKRGLTYGVNSEFAPMLGHGPFLISLSTKNQQADKALEITENTLQHFINEGPTQQELDAAKRFITGSFPLSLGSNKSIVNLLVRASFYHLPDSYLDTYITHINSVTTQQIQQAFQRRLDTKQLLLIKVGQS